ncbi:hypothetical protein BVRB_027910 [Beta vulgaris subsp. vulgaris]|uniref:SMCHD1 ribosomal S5 domain-containing protein n=1 Tax=Beta vulgaris subsp. vulgaris TaxID=3555 RepID=A0A0J8B1N7_BETVV|nr:hypothetical protein BVRB_027910 [Beta vulgaris subsp. vulgaris]
MMSLCYYFKVVSRSVPSVIKEQLQRKKDTFSFEIVDSENGFGVFGFVNYFPFNDVETYPKESQILAQWCGTPEPDSDDEDDDSNVNNGLDPSEQSIHPIFSCWWQGTLDALPFLPELIPERSSYPNNNCGIFQMDGSFI